MVGGSLLKLVEAHWENALAPEDLILCLGLTREHLVDDLEICLGCMG